MRWRHTREREKSQTLSVFSEMGTPQRGARTVPVRSAWAGRGALEKGDVFGPDNPLRTGTVRGPMQRGPYAAKQIPPPVGEKVPEGRLRGDSDRFMVPIARSQGRGGSP